MRIGHRGLFAMLGSCTARHIGTASMHWFSNTLLGFNGVLDGMSRLEETPADFVSGYMRITATSLQNERNARAEEMKNLRS